MADLGWSHSVTQATLEEKKKKGSADTPIIRSREVRNTWVIVSVHAVKMNETILTSRR